MAARATGGDAQPVGNVNVKVVGGGEPALSPLNAGGGTVWLTARYEGDDLRISVVSAAPYGKLGRTATASVDVPADDEDLARVRKALDKLMDRFAPQAAEQAQKAAARAWMYATDAGEE